MIIYCIHDYVCIIIIDNVIVAKRSSFNHYRRKHSKVNASIFAKIRLGAESYSSLGRVGKKENSVSTFGRFRLRTSFESSPVSVNRLIEISHPADFGLTLKRPKNHKWHVPWHLWQFHKLWIYELKIFYCNSYIIDRDLHLFNYFSTVHSKSITTSSSSIVSWS